jgi:hypothetical protein
MRPLKFMVADKNMEACLHGLFDRPGWHESMGCARIDVVPGDVYVAAGHADSGLYAHGSELLRQLADTCEHMVVMVDAEWEGSPGVAVIEARMRAHLAKAGWPDERGLALVFDPEVDTWLWTRTDHTARALGWPNWSTLEPALVAENLWLPGAPKPPRPKEAATWALRREKRARSSNVYKRVASTVGLGRCTDPAFVALRGALQAWFPLEGA